MNQQTQLETWAHKNQAERRIEATRHINATLAKLVAVEEHDRVRQQLLEIIAASTGYRHALLSEMEEDERHLRVVAAHMPQRLIQGAEALLGFQLIGHRVVNEPGIVLQTPPTEIFEHIYEWRPEIARPISNAVEFLMGIQQIVSIRLHTGDYYLGAANFFATRRDTDLELLEYLCNNHLVYALRLIQEQAARERLQNLRTEELRREVAIRQQAEEAIRTLYTITADQKMTFSEKVQALLTMGCRRFGLTTGILAHVVQNDYQIEEVYAPGTAMEKGQVYQLNDTYCVATLQADGPLSFEHAGQSQWAKHPCYRLFHLESYLGTAVRVLTEEGSYVYGTLSFSSHHSKASKFQPSDHEFLSLMAQWIGGEIERAHRTEQMQAYAAQLERAHQELAETHSQALEVSRLKSEFLATMSHEIRTPMNGIIGMTELLTTTDLNERQQYYAHTVLKETEHLLNIVNDILDFSKIEAGKLTLGYEGFSPLTIIESVASLLSSRAAEKQLALMTYVASDVPTVLYGDASRLRQILLNLVGNAIKFTDHGDIMITLTAQSVYGNRVELHFQVQDTGIGIDNAKLDYIFQPFTQVDGGVTRRHGGTGLGLAITHRLISLMNGQIGVESKPRCGSNFWFTIPFERSTPALNDSIAIEKSLTGIRILVVETHQRHAQILKHYFSEWGASVDLAAARENGFSLLTEAVAQNRPYQIVLIEQSPPSVDGIALARQIREEPLLAATNLLMLTPFTDERAQKEAEEIGFSAYLTKPFRKIELLNAAVKSLIHEPADGNEQMNWSI